MPDADKQHQQAAILHSVNDPVITHAHAPAVITSREGFAARRPRIILEGQKTLFNALAQLGVSQVP